jgi:tetratricopeptide (TPR) repeat protein
MSSRTIAWLSLTAIVAACGGPRSRETAAAAARDAPTFTRDVAPIVFRHCAPCHRPGESAPFSLLSYADVRQRARTIASVTERRFMPPWLPEPGHGDFAGERRLTRAEIETLRRWEEQGAPEGIAGDLPPLPHFTEGWRLGEPDLVVRLPKPYVLPANGSDVWRNFVIAVPVTETRYVKTVELRPGSARFIHHALMGIDTTRSSRRRDEKDAEPGFDGMDMGDSQAPDGHLLGWTPGMAPFPGVEGKAWRIDAGTDFVLQLHMIPSGKPENVDPAVGLYFAKEPPVGPPMYLFRLDADQMLDIPAGAEDFTVTDSLELPVDVHVYAIYPHAHFLGKTMEGLAKLPDGTEQWLIRINDWNFKWQDVYRYAKPVFLPRGTTISMRYTYDNSADNERNPNHPPRRVVAGLRSSDEMAHLQLQVLPARVEDALLLKEALYRHAAVKTPGDPWAHYELGNVFRDKGQIPDAVREYRAALVLDARNAAAHNNLGAVLADLGQLNDAMGHYRQALRAEPDFADAHYNLANALRAEGRIADAIARYHEALRLEPNLVAAHTNLGEALVAVGVLEEAIAHFRSVVRISPGSAEAHNNLGAALAMQGRLAEAIDHFRQALTLDAGHARARENLEIALERFGRSGSARP